jgi:predicted dehydrogenase
VLCEKPLCATVGEAREIERAEKESGRFVSVGYQMSFSRSIQALKRDIAGGVFGRPELLKTIVHYPRNESYYSRNSWAGRKFTADGRPVNDSPLHNAVAHHINNILFVLGGAPDRAAAIKTVQAELYRGNPDVENFDTAALRCKVAYGGAAADNEVEVLFYTSHSLARTESFGPVCQYRFEKATIVHIDEREHEVFYAMFDDGRTIRYTPADDEPVQKLWDCIEAARRASMSQGDNLAPQSGVAAAIPEVQLMEAAQKSHPVVTIPEKYVRRIGEPGKRITDVAGLEETLLACFEQNLLPSELGADIKPDWAQAGKTVDVARDIHDRKFMNGGI